MSDFLFACYQLWFRDHKHQGYEPAPGQSALPLSPAVAFTGGVPPSLCPNSMITQSSFLIFSAMAANLPSLVKVLALRPAYAELLTNATEGRNEYWRYWPQPSVPLWPPPGAAVLSPASQIVGIGALGSLLPLEISKEDVAAMRAGKRKLLRRIIAIVKKSWHAQNSPPINWQVCKYNCNSDFYIRTNTYIAMQNF